MTYTAHQPELEFELSRLIAFFAAAPPFASSPPDLSPMPAALPILLVLSGLSLPIKIPNYITHHSKSNSVTNN